MPVIRHADPEAFLVAAAAVLARDEADAMMFESRARGLAARPLPDGLRAYLATFRGPLSLGIALRIGSSPLFIGPSDRGAARAFADDLARDGVELCGVIGAADACRDFALRWRRRTGARHALRFRLRHHMLGEVRTVPAARGFARVAVEGDLDWLVQSQLAFLHESGVPEPPSEQPSRIARGIGEGLYWIWDDDGPACYAGWLAATAIAARIGPVYTPPERRRHGYATALVASLARSLRAGGRRDVSLSSDVANPTASAIYVRIGFEPTREIDHLDFLPPSPR